MALQVNYNSERVGHTYPDAYCKVVRFGGDGVRVRFHIAIFVSKAARDADLQPVDVAQAELDYDDAMPSGSALTWLYNQVKASDPRFAGSTDI